MLLWSVQRWRMKVTFEEARDHLGIETQRQGNNLGHCALDTDAVRLVFAGKVDSQQVDQRSDADRSDGGLVCQRATNLQRRTGLGKTLFVE